MKINKISFIEWKDTEVVLAGGIWREERTISIDSTREQNARGALG
jgi:hypothetical protein